MTLVLAIDPGVTTGLASNIHVPLLIPVRPLAWQFSSTEHDSPHWEFLETLENYDPDVIVCERFDFRQAKLGVDYTAVEYIGLVKLHCEINNVPIIWQGQDAKSKKSFWTDDKLKQLGLYIPGQPHAMDAQKHLLKYQLDHGQFDLNLLKPSNDGNNDTITITSTRDNVTIINRD